MKDEMISVIVPNYNGQKTLKLCLDAIYQQDYPKFEVIFVDDMSTDDSVKIARGYDCKILSTEKNGGPAVTRNLGAKHAKGDILFFVDSDVALNPDALSVAMKKFREDPKLGAVCGIYDKKPLIRDSLVEEYRVLQDHYWKKSGAGYITTLNVADGAIRKDVFVEVGGFKSHLRQSEDIDLGQRISLKYKILGTSEIVGRHDCDDTLSRILKSFHTRAGERVEVFVKRRTRFFKGYNTSSRSLGTILAATSLVTTLLGFINIYLLIIPILFFVGFLFSDLGLYVFVQKEKGTLFLIYFTLIHFLVNLAIFSGIIKGSIKRGVKR